MTTEQTLAARLAKIMGELGPIEKKGKITSQGSGPTYKFARDSDVLAAAAPRMATEGIVLVPEHVELLSLDTSLSGKQFIANIKASWHVTDGKESIRFETFGQGADVGDKALPKAQSNARKYAFFMLYHIVTGDDPDHWASFEQPERDSGRQHAGRRADAPAETPARATRTPEEQTLADELLALTADEGHEYMEQLADEVGVPKGQRANADQLREMIALAIGHAAGTDTSAVARAADQDGAPSEELSDASGGVPATAGAPPKSTSTEEAIARARRKAAEAQKAEQEALPLGAES